jgi:FMN reductase
MTSSKMPLILGIGGTLREGSSTERALTVALRAVEAKGARTRLLGGAFLASLPIYNPASREVTESQEDLARAVSEADGIIVASPGYHGSISGVIKNTLDTLEALRGEPETLLARMSGSGATCFALCAGDIEAEGLAERLRSMRPDWWVRRCQLS